MLVLSFSRLSVGEVKKRARERKKRPVEPPGVRIAALTRLTTTRSHSTLIRLQKHKCSSLISLAVHLSLLRSPPPLRPLAAARQQVLSPLPVSLPFALNLSCVLRRSLFALVLRQPPAWPLSSSPLVSFSDLHFLCLNPFLLISRSVSVYHWLSSCW